MDEKHEIQNPLKVDAMLSSGLALQVTRYNTIVYSQEAQNGKPWNMSTLSSQYSIRG
jgi:hypothetical protein